MSTTTNDRSFQALSAEVEAEIEAAHIRGDRPAYRVVARETVSGRVVEELYTDDSDGLEATEYLQARWSGVEITVVERG